MPTEPDTTAARRTYLRRAAVVLLAGIPLAIVPGAENRFVFGRLVVAALAALLLLAIPGAGRLPRWMWLSVGAVTLVAGIAAGRVLRLAAPRGVGPVHRGRAD